MDKALAWLILVGIAQVVGAVVVRLPLEHGHSCEVFVPSITGSNQQALTPDRGGLPLLGLANNIVNISVGTPAQQFRLAVGTDDADTWVLGENCRSDICLRHNRYRSSASSSYKSDGTDFERTMDWGTARGVFSVDEISVGSVSAHEAFGEVSDVSALFGSARFDGILGLGFGRNGSRSFMERVSWSGQLDEPLYSVFLAAGSFNDPSPAYPSTNTSELMLGGINKSSFRGELVDLALRPGARHWDVDLDALGFDKYVLEPTGLHVRFDTFTTWVGVPSNILAFLAARLPNAGPALCKAREKLPDLVFKMGGKDFALSAYEYTWEYRGVCYLQLYSNDHRLDETPRIDLGMPFLRQWYSVYNFEKRTVSLGRAVQGDRKD